MITESQKKYDMFGVKLENMRGKWDEIDRLIFDNVTYILLENRELGDIVPYVIIEKPPYGEISKYGCVPREYIIRMTYDGFDIIDDTINKTV
jgi:hypothetical protein